MIRSPLAITVIALACTTVASCQLTPASVSVAEAEGKTCESSLGGAAQPSFSEYEILRKAFATTDTGTNQVVVVLDTKVSSEYFLSRMFAPSEGSPTSVASGTTKAILSVATSSARLDESEFEDLPFVRVRENELAGLFSPEGQLGPSVGGALVLHASRVGVSCEDREAALFLFEHFFSRDNGYVWTYGWKIVFRYEDDRWVESGRFLAIVT